MEYQIRHTTVYRYAEPLCHSVHELRLAPRSGELQQVKGWQIHAPDNLTCTADDFSNIAHRSTLGSRIEDVTIDARGIVGAFPADSSGSQRFVDTPKQGHYRVSPLYFLSPTPLTSAPVEMIDFARGHALVHGDAEFAVRLAQAIATCVRCKPNTTHVGAAVAEAFGLGAGVCQNQAQVMVAYCRALGVPTRYASGYSQAMGEEDPASHAWADVCFDAESHAWCSIGVTRQHFTDTRHIRLAVRRDCQSTVSVHGVWRSGDVETLDVNISTEPLPTETTQVNWASLPSA